MPRANIRFNLTGVNDMTNEERDLITRFIARVGGGGQGGGFGGSVPQIQPAGQPALPPIDRDADALIAQLFGQYPDARYRITQTAVVQEAALAEAQNRIQRLQWELDQTRQAVAQAAPQQKGFFSSLFGGTAGQPGQRPMGAPMQAGYGQAFQPTSPPPQPQYPPNYQPGMFGRGGGSGFLGSALTTAAGVAGGMVVGNALMSAFEGHHGAAASPWGADTAGGDPAGFGGAGVVPTDPSAGYDQQASNDPFGGAGVDQGGGGYDTQTGFDGGGVDNGGGGGFDAGGGGGFDGGGFDNT